MVETLAPPTTATKGCSGSSTTRDSAATSRSIRKPAALRPRADSSARRRHDRGVGAVGGAEGVVDVVAEGLRQTGGEFGIVGLFAGMETEVLQQQQRARLGVGDGRVEAVRNKTHRSSEGRLRGPPPPAPGSRPGRERPWPCRGGSRRRPPSARSISQRRVGRAATIRVSSRTSPSAHRHVEVEPGEDPRAVEFLEIGEGGQAHPLSFADHVLEEIDAAQRVGVLVVVPARRPGRSWAPPAR